MNKSNQTYKELSIPFFKEVFDIIDEVMISMKVPYYLIGASAIALELLNEGIKPSRGTKDIDFAIMISSINEFKEIIKKLADHGFNKVEAPWTLYSPKYNIVIDLLPFGEIEENSTFNFNERYTDLHVLGFNEVLSKTKTINIEEKSLKIPSLEGMVILKLISWSDRPEERNNDLFDILRIIEHYFELNYDEILEIHNDTFTDEEIDPYKIAARVLGRKSKVFLNLSKAINKRILTTIDNEIEAPEKSIIAKKWSKDKQWDISYTIELINEFKTGLIE